MAHTTQPASRRAGRRAPELLAPAGGPGPFAAALAAGADAIYLGMGSFNARRKADNFDDASFEQACRQAHLAGARVYVTVNIVIKDFEMPEALELVRRCAALGADAFIIQDWGLFFEVRRLMPEIETHVSTQANIHDARGAAWCRDAGADRVTLSRELSVAEIAHIHQAVDIELEVFAHGSICFCYSGVCLLSSFACAGRSANRGMCAQPCRLPYELVDESGRTISAPDRGRPLCPRDTNTSEMLGSLIDAGAGALKLEGRMKAPDYVYAVTDAYRRALDDVLAGREPDPSEREARARQLKRCFNRDFTHAYQDGASGDEMMSYERSNNRGQIVGEVVGFVPRTPRNRAERFRERDKGPAGVARIALTEPVGTGDLLELRHDDEPDQFLTALARADAPAGATIEVDVPRAMPAGCVVRIIRSQRAIDAANAVLKREIPRKRLVHVAVEAHLGEPFRVALTCLDDPGLTAGATGFVVEAARTKAVTADDLAEHVGRLGSSPFEAASFDIALDEGCGMGFSAVHKVRTAAAQALEDLIAAPYAARAERLRALPAMSGAALTGDTDREAAAATTAMPAIVAIAATPEAADAARTAGAARIYMTTDALEAAGITPETVRSCGITPILDEVCRERDHERLDRWCQAGAGVAVGNISELVLAAEVGASPEVRPTIPVHNLACLRALERAGATGLWLSPELTLDEIGRFAPHAATPVGITVFGKPRVMTSEHCILQVADACIHDCARCALRRRRHWLRNIDGLELPVTTDVHGRSHLFDARAIDLTQQLPQLIRAGVTRFAVDGTLLTPDELGQAVARAVRARDAALAGRKPAPRAKGSTVGCLFVGVD